MSILLSAGILCLTAHATPIPVILDTDIGGDIDDTWALCMLLNSPQLDLKLIVTAFDDTQAKTRLAAKMLERLGRTDVPIGTGKKTSSEKLNQADWLGDYSLDGYKGKVHEDGVQAMIDLLHAAKEKITLCVIGPQTNIAEALKRDPSIAQKARIVSMAGSVHIGYQGKPKRDPEYNVVADIPAARAVFAAPWDITFAPLDTCGLIQLKGENYLNVSGSDQPSAKVVIENYTNWSNRKHFAENESSVLFDTEAVYLMFDEALVEMETVKLSVDDKGATVPDEKGRPVRCALRWKDRAAFESLLVKILTGK
ncbi:MAG TPA: nucleoside hydrolase [Candidatus Hydrogenedentes bacterium]|nr:nucleoside hydrolase [Candidatus Hydrogenedentota bacterium]